jgi:hypothetical protein
MIVFIGDAHGKIKLLMRKVAQAEPHPTFQLGDMGIGFKGVGFGKQRETFKWFRGNHDNPAKCRAYHNYLGDYGTLEVEGRNIFYLAGAYSIDAQWRTPGETWWEDEELSWEELDKAYALYAETKPDLVISHECPSEIGRRLLAGLLNDYQMAKTDCCTSRTSRALQRMFDVHQPKDWVFGHYHIDQELSVNGTKFRCCNELSTYCLGEEIISHLKAPYEVSGHSGASILVAEQWSFNVQSASSSSQPRNSIPVPRSNEVGTITASLVPASSPLQTTASKILNEKEKTIGGST